MSEEQMRKEFEAWCPVANQRDSSGDYVEPFARAYWRAWKAALSAEPTSQIMNSQNNFDSALRSPGNWRVGLFWSSSNPEKKVRCLAEGDEEISEYESRKDFIQWLAATQPQAPQGAVTPEFKLVPIEPNDAIINAMNESYFDGSSCEPGTVHYEIWVQTYKAAISAAPETPEVRK